MTSEDRSTVKQMRDARTGKLYLQGREETTPERANIFGNGDGEPVATARHRRIAYEAEVVYAFAARADDNATDNGKVFRFRLWSWSYGEDGAQADLLLDWQDFIGDDPPDAEYGWNRLLGAAVERLRRARSDPSAVSNALVGSP